MPRSTAIAGSPLDWLSRSQSNLSRAQQPKPDDVYLEDLCFDAQQAAEKALKALLLNTGLKFRFVHDIGELLNELTQANVEVPERVIESAELTTFAVEARYPGPFEAVTEEEYRRALYLAETVVAWVRSILLSSESEPESLSLE